MAATAALEVQMLVCMYVCLSVKPSTAVLMDYMNDMDMDYMNYMMDFMDYMDHMVYKI